MLGDHLDGGLPDAFGVLDDICLQRASARDRVLRLFGRVVADYCNVLSPRGIEHGRRPKRRVVIDAEDALQVGVRLQHVFHDRHRSRTLSVTGRLADDVDAWMLFHFLFEAANSVLNRCDDWVVDDEHVAGVTDVLRERLRREPSPLHVVAGDV